MGLDPAPSVVAVAVAGTIVVYNVDRLRDLERDRLTAPDRTAFVERHRLGLSALSAASGVVSVAMAATLGWRAIAWLAPVALLGFFHRRLKGIPFAKAAYITAAWLAVTVALPAVAALGGSHRLWVAGVLAAAIFANAIASNIRDREGAIARFGRGPALRAARILATAGIAVAAFAPEGVRPLAAVPAAMLIALLTFRDDHRYGLWVVDGALVLGGLAALALS
jgi:hypothetical protein